MTQLPHSQLASCHSHVRHAPIGANGQIVTSQKTGIEVSSWVAPASEPWSWDEKAWKDTLDNLGTGKDDAPGDVWTDEDEVQFQRNMREDSDEPPSSELRKYLKHGRGLDIVAVDTHIGETMLTKAEVYEKVKRHLLAQNKRALTTWGQCAYRGCDGTSCAVGCLIPDEHYDQGFEGATVNGITQRARKLRDALRASGVNIDDASTRTMLANLQKLHDGTSPSGWASHFKKHPTP